MIVVHSPDQWSLVDEGGSGFHEQIQSLDRFSRQFPWMIEMRHDVDFFVMGAEFFDHFQKRRIVDNSERIEGGNFGADADDVYVIQLPKKNHSWKRSAKNLFFAPTIITSP